MCKLFLHVKFLYCLFNCNVYIHYISCTHWRNLEPKYEHKAEYIELNSTYMPNQCYLTSVAYLTSVNRKIFLNPSANGSTSFTGGMWSQNMNIELNKYKVYCQWKQFFSHVRQMTAWKKKCIHWRNTVLN